MSGGRARTRQHIESLMNVMARVRDLVTGDHIGPTRASEARDLLDKALANRKTLAACPYCQDTGYYRDGSGGGMRANAECNYCTSAERRERQQARERKS